MFKKFIDWLVTSSADPEEYSMTIQGVLLHALGILVPFLTYLHLPFTVAQITNQIGLSCQILGITLSIVGLVRKGYFAIKSLFTKTPPATGTTAA